MHPYSTRSISLTAARTMLVIAALCGACGSDTGTNNPSLAAGSGTTPPTTSPTAGTPAAVGGAGTPAPSAAGAGAAGSTTAGRSGGSSGTPSSTAGTPSSTAGTPSAGSPSTAGTPAPAAGSGGSAGAPTPAAGSGAPSAGPTLPPIDNPGTSGPFQSRFVSTAPGLSTHSLFVPDKTGTHGKHPMVVWTCGNGGSVSFYTSFLEHVASHGFFVVADKGSSSDRMAEVKSQNDAIAWIVAENSKAGGEYSGKLDIDNIAVMGHSLGSLASFATAAMNKQVAASIHFSGGLTGNPVGFDMSWLASMTKPAAFLCGGNDSTAGPACAEDFAKAPPALPVFYGVLSGADHIGPFLGTPRGGEYGRAGVAWLRWQLADDPAFKEWFSGASCKLCASPWKAMQRNLD